MPVILRHLPLCLTAIRALLAPVMIVLALCFPSKIAFGFCLAAAFVSDVFDGVLARKLGIATPGLRRLDSIADTLFYSAAAFAAWYLYPSVFAEHAIGIAFLVALEIARYAFDLRKFGREASYHMWSSKVWGIALFAGLFSLLALGVEGASVVAAIYFGILTDVEGLAISIVLREWKTDVPTIVHALRANNRLRGI